MKKQSITTILVTLFLVLGTMIAMAESPVAETSALRHGPEKGSLVIIGGGTITDSIWDKIVELGGGKDKARFVVVTNAMPGKDDQYFLNAMKPLTQRVGETNVTLLGVKTISEANDEKNLEVLKHATGIFFFGGFQKRLADVYHDTLAHREFQNVLARGGVIAGTSAGATIQGSLLWRWEEVNKKRTGKLVELPIGLGFLRDSLIAQHLLARNRQFGYVGFAKASPQILCIGLDESTAVVVIKDEMEVIGKSYAALYNTGGLPFFLLKEGLRYDLNERKIITSKKETSNTETPHFDFQTSDGKTIPVYYLLPKKVDQKTKILFVMNGADRNALGNVDRFSKVPDTLNIAVLIPLLTREDYNESRYQQGNIGSKTEYSEWTFNLVDSIFVEFRKKQNLQAEKYILFGHSAGGQFSHRTALFSKSPYIGLVVAANSGSYTFLNEEVNYPYGIKDMLKHKDTILKNLSNRKVYLLAGSADTSQDDPYLPKNLNEQGLHRFERAGNFDKTTRDYAEKNGVKYNWKLIKMDGVGHSSSQTLPHLIKVISAQEK
ncbi:MAG: cyanophycinase [Planctomycetaceae bacterium]|jgi:cyanophycinase|nr:cyanophycinase [Planctomycetaceae bacterium]